MRQLARFCLQQVNPATITGRVPATRPIWLAAGWDLPAMLIWAALIISLVAFGFGTQLWGMIIVLPLLGHATWHAYRDIAEEQ